MRRTDFPQGVPGGFGVASFVWDATEDGPLPTGVNHLRGELPVGSVVIGGFYHVAKTVSGASSLSFYLGTPAKLIAGFGASSNPSSGPLINGQLGDPTKNLVISTDADSRMVVEVEATPCTAGQFALYLFYVNNDLGEFGQAKTPTLYKRSKSPVALPSEIKVASFVWDSATDGSLPRYYSESLSLEGNPLRGEVPAGSVVVGGFIHVTQALLPAQHTEFRLGSDIIQDNGGGYGVGFFELTLGKFDDPTKNIVVNTSLPVRVLPVPAPGISGQFSVYLFYVTNQVGVYGNLGERRRTESPEARPGEMRLATFVWDGAQDAPLTVGSNYIKGEVPIGSIVVGGFFHCEQLFATGSQTVPWYLGSTLMLTTDFGLPVGWYQSTLGNFSDPTKNLLVKTEAGSRMSVNIPTTPTTAGRVVAYLFYINNELGLHGQIANPHSSQIT